MLGLLVPFALTTALYFHLLIPSSQPSLTATVVKCLPIYSLAAAAYFYCRTEPSRSRYGSLIIFGLLLSSIGDICLVWPGYFIVGMISFALAHCCYISAFGLSPLKLGILVPLAGICGAITTQIIPGIKDDLIAKGVPVYGVFLVAMSWRALSYASSYPNTWSWPKLCAALGSISFLVSDTVLSFHELVGHPIPNAQVIILSTYYLAQLGITLSVTHS